MDLNRRSFLRLALAAGAFPMLPGCFSPRGYAANGKVRLAAIGCGAQGWFDLDALSKNGDICEVVALCDTDIGAPHTLEALRRFPDLPRFQDFRKMFDAMADGIDAVLVATPDHSHFCAAMHAMRLGKAVYVEKPLAHSFRECELLMKAERKFGVVTQMGNQGHSGENFYQFKHYVETGVIDVSKLTKLVAHMNNPRRWHKWNGNVSSFPPAEEIPVGLDWDTWLGTAAFHDYSKDFVQGEWRSWYDFGNGCLGDWGAHTMDTMHRFFDLGLPSEIRIRDVQGWNPFVFPMQDTLTFKFAAKGARPAIDLDWYEGVTNAPELPAGYKFQKWDSSIPTAKGSTADVASKLVPGKFFYMADGTVWQGGSHSKPISRCGDEGPVPEFPKPGSDHYANFLLAVMGKEETRSPFSVAAPLSEVFCLGCIAQRLNRGFKFDPATKQVVGDETANRLMKGSAGTPRRGWEEFYKV